ncbi:FkbM family methyltransferase [Jannaschia pohangensis]|uniref:Methyltransferase, FkbM family n=1 Tax=Jannaschia pohangensis TaxID=390807 RepID=A0A1I3TV73_9RHOB|nr:FkbM family methyltransferase [Jannaschia pohangensis]SFJ75154.1 methyltransferase, FkbM family [Jannaschia pohangensis]
MTTFRTFKRRMFLRLREGLGTARTEFAPHGVPVTVPRAAGVDMRYLLERGRPYEDPEAALIRAHIAPGTPVIELGGCLGIVSALVRSVIGPDARHIVVEAMPDLAPIARLNATRGAGAGKAEVVEAAVDYSGADHVTFAVGHSAHVGHVAGAGEAGLKVPVTTLSALADRLGADRFALVCDIEGAELALFEHETEVMSRIDVIVLETHERAYPNGKADLEAMCARIAAAGLPEVARIDGVYCFKRG